MPTVDLNADVGEGADGGGEIYGVITSANIACGGHAGNEATMREAVRRAVRRGVAIGAHPGFEDREHFGREERVISASELEALVKRQVEALRRVVASEEMAEGNDAGGDFHRAFARVEHVKPHGALYNLSARDPVLAKAIADAVWGIDPGLILVGLAGSVSLDAARARGLRVASEGFADRRYLASGALAPRARPDALIEDPNEAAAQAVGMVREGRVATVEGGGYVPVRADTICLHGDNPQAVAFAVRIRTALQKAGIAVRRFR